MHKARTILVLLGIISMSTINYAAYKITGKINMEGAWQHQIYLATIDKLDNYYSANAQYIINTGDIDNEGNFIIQGDNLPNEDQFYRLYVIKEEHSEFNACLFVGGEEHNFIHLLLNNNNTIDIQADLNTFAPFGNYTIKGDTKNKLMKSLSKIVYPSYIFYEIKFPSELKFSEDKLNRDLFQFADTCKNTLVSLAAINNTDFDSYFDTKFDQYKNFGSELTETYPNHPYTTDYYRKLKYYGPIEIQSGTNLFKLLSVLLGLGFIWMTILYLRLKRNSKKGNTQNNKQISCTPQEIKILELISLGKSNKEIANDLFIELSTVKTHINKLYSKLGVKNRQEAIKISKDHIL